MMSQLKKSKIDNRTSEDILDSIEKLAKSYTPEWQLDKENPDVGMALAKVYSTQMGESIDMLNQVIDNYHTEFVNMLSISPNSARPAEGLVEFSTSIDTIPGTYIPKQTKLTSDEDEPVIYETQHGVYVTSSNIPAIYLVDGEEGFITPIKGTFTKPGIIENEEIDNEFAPFRLFGEDKTISRNALYFYHDELVDTMDNPLFIRIEGNDQLLKGIETGKYEIKWYTTEGWKPFEKLELLEDQYTIKLIRDSESQIEKVALQGKKYNLISIETDEPVSENLVVDSITFSSKGEARPIDFVTNGALDFEAERFNIFGETLAPFTNCYIGMEQYFSKLGSKIHMEFDVSYATREEGLTQQQIEESLKIIKKKPKKQIINVPSECHVDEISVEYFNGTGWKKLNCDSVNNYIFAEDKPGKYKMDFVCPIDWKETQAGAYSGRMIKLSVLKADNSYMRPCIYHYPVVSNFKVSYSYEDRYIAPHKVKSIFGTNLVDLTKNVLEGKKYNAFSRTEYFSDALYIGFSRELEEGPISMMFELEDMFDAKPLKYVLEYYSNAGFKPLRIQDYTDGMTHTGTIKFIPQQDAIRHELEGKNLYWIRILRNKVAEVEQKKLLPVIKNIRLNVVEIANINTLEDREIYIDDVVPNVKFTLGVEGILDAQVWVNELGHIGRSEIVALQKEDSDSIDVDYDSYGNISRCYIRYEECDTLEVANNKRSYILDRINSELIFGDGVKTFIPRVTNDTAILLKLRTSIGSKGNANQYTVTGSLGTLLYIDTISNPLKLTNGSDMEDIDDALERGSFLLQSRNRLVSKNDYKREIVFFSDSIHDVEVICELMKNGKENPLAVSCVILLEDYKIGFGAFAMMAADIKNHLLENCELTISENNLHIVDPIFVDISVDVWVESLDIDQNFEIQTILKESLNEYLNPLNGWKIGTLPKPSQLMMKINSIKNMAMIKKTIFVAKYTDAEGVHEMDLKDVKISPYMVCRSGEHNVHIILAN